LVTVANHRDKVTPGTPAGYSGQRHRGADDYDADMFAVGNLEASGRRRRFRLGALSIALGVVVLVGLTLGGASPGWRWLTFVPFWGGFLGLLQAGTST